jgi:citrate synthase
MMSPTNSPVSTTPPPPAGFRPGLEGHVAFRTRIAEPDRDGGALRYRGVDVEDLAGRVTFGNVWALLVDGRFGPGLPPAEPFPIPVHSGDVRVDVQAGLAMLAPYWGYKPLLDVTDDEARENLARASVMALSYVAQSARGIGVPAVPQRRIDECATITERFMTRWRGEPDPAHVRAVDAYWVSAAEHGLNASTFTARVIASTLSDMFSAMTGAIGALKGPLHGGANEEAQKMAEEVDKPENAEAYVRERLANHQKVMGFGHAVYRTMDPRATVLKELCRQLGERRGQPKWYEIFAALEATTLEQKGLYPNVDLYAAGVYHMLGIPTDLMTPIFALARMAGWTAHVREQYADNRIIRPGSTYVGPRDRVYVPIDERG